MPKCLYETCISELKGIVSIEAWLYRLVGDSARQLDLENGGSLTAVR